MRIAVAFSLLVLQALAQSDNRQCPSICGCYLLNNLLVVDCWGRDILSFPGNMHELVQVLDLSSNAIRTIDDNVGHYAQLQLLRLSKNQIQALPPTAFKNMPSLQSLDLSYNNISDLSQINADTFIENNVRLKELNLAGNPITNLGTDSKTVSSVLTSSSLLKLYLSDCKIDTVSGLAALKNLPKLEYLDLSKNPIKWIRNFGSPSLIHLDLSYCELDFLSPTALVKFPSLRNLSLNGNSALSLTAGGLISSSLSHLEAAYCSITRPRLNSLPNLVYADFKGNKVVRLREGEFQSNRYLKELDLSHNIIVEIHSDTFNGADYLENLNLAHNSISNELPAQIFSRNQYLKFLNVSRNDINSLNNFDNPSLKFLDVSKCQIRTLDRNILTKLPWLVSLSLSANLLEDIPNHITSNTLMDLDLSYCRLSTIRNETFSQLLLLRSLDLTGNRLTEPIDVTILERLTHLNSIWLGDNPWHCNCESKKFKSLWTHITKGERILKTESKLVKCQTPEKFRGTSWENSCYTEWYPAPVSSKEKFTRYGIIFLICFFSLAAVFLIASTITKKIYSRKKRRTANEERERREARVAQQSRHSSESEAADEVIIRLRESPVSTPRWISNPPTYEEALLMSPVRTAAEEPSHGPEPSRGGTPAAERSSARSRAGSIISTAHSDADPHTSVSREASSDVEDDDRPVSTPRRPRKRKSTSQEEPRVAADTHSEQL